MPLLQTISDWLQYRRQDRIAVASARRHFEANTGERSIKGMSIVVGREPRGAIVRVCSGHVKPPRRAWFVVSPDGSIVTELPVEEVQRLGLYKGPWR
jgi:hypothetical protein